MKKKKKTKQNKTKQNKKQTNKKKQQKQPWLLLLEQKKNDRSIVFPSRVSLLAFHFLGSFKRTSLFTRMR